MKRISSILIIVGILIACYPFARDTYRGYWELKLLKQWEEGSVGQQFREMNDVLNTGEQIPSEDDATVYNPSIQEGTMGIIQIPKIDVLLPILPGASNSNLNKGAGHLTETNELGEIGNSAVAAHRSHTYGRFFNRLDELEVGDKIIIKTYSGEFIYTVYDKKIVVPTDLSVLKSTKEERILTLITCTPLYRSTHRLIIHAKVI
ncbi:class D sortase [Alkalicella caledoniensis]|uniref:Class D sortase n=1 Tax=Alkalicella caledoniensis TaxID=2731377 RepID=A0A7G9W6B0_ALKCA|nr:class D sortase [Alkalicella caledoniensis]QNO14222.1 class D sortase [Alkalicella caledoniensis]